MFSNEYCVDFRKGCLPAPLSSTLGCSCCQFNSVFCEPVGVFHWHSMGLCQNAVIIQFLVVDNAKETHISRIFVCQKIQAESCLKLHVAETERLSGRERAREECEHTYLCAQCGRVIHKTSKTETMYLCVYVCAWDLCVVCRSAWQQQQQQQ